MCFRLCCCAPAAAASFFQLVNSGVTLPLGNWLTQPSYPFLNLVQHVIREKRSINQAAHAGKKKRSWGFRGG